MHHRQEAPIVPRLPRLTPVALTVRPQAARTLGPVALTAHRMPRRPPVEADPLQRPHLVPAVEVLRRGLAGEAVGAVT